MHRDDYESEVLNSSLLFRTDDNESVTLNLKYILYLVNFIESELTTNPFCWFPFPKKNVYSDAVLDKLRQRYKSFLPEKDAERKNLKVADGLSPLFLKISRTLNYSGLCKWEYGNCLSKKNFKKKHENHWMTIKNSIKVINWPYKFMADRLSILWPLKRNRQLMV